MEFHITEDQRRLQERCRSLAADFASRAAQHDREANTKYENRRQQIVSLRKHVADLYKELMTLH